MDYIELLWRCRRVIGVKVETDSDLSLTDIVNLLHSYPAGTSRHVAAEKLAHEMAEWIEAETHPVRAAAQKAH